MRIAITQPNFLPWLGYFELLDKVEHFVVLDNVQLVKRSFMVRNRLFSSNREVVWHSLAIKKCPQETPMNKATVSADEPWWEEAFRRIQAAYSATPFWHEVAAPLQEMLVPLPGEAVSEYNWRIILRICGLLGINLHTRWTKASALQSQGAEFPTAENRILDLCSQLGARSLYNFSKGVEIGLYQPEHFRAQAMELYQQCYVHPVYAQHRDLVFTPFLSVIDVLCCVGSANSLNLIREGRCWKKAG